MTEYIILVTGSRDWTDKNIIEKTLKELIIPPQCLPVLVHGACPSGADAIAHTVAENLKWTVRKYPADWQKFKKQAGPIRNKLMIDTEQPHVILAFRKNKSPGTTGTIDLTYLYANTLTSRLKVFTIYDQNNDKNNFKTILNKN